MSQPYEPTFDDSTPATLSGKRIQFSSRKQPFPYETQFGVKTGCFDKGNEVQVYIASVYDGDAIWPGYISPRPKSRGDPSVYYASDDGKEHGHNGKLDLLPMTDDMEWVDKASFDLGHIAVVGGKSASGSALYHTIGNVEIATNFEGCQVLGYMDSAVGFGGSSGLAHEYKGIFRVLCWKAGRGPLDPAVIAAKKAAEEAAEAKKIADAAEAKRLADVEAKRVADAAEAKRAADACATFWTPHWIHRWIGAPFYYLGYRTWPYCAKTSPAA
ncbi:hypothetical protein RQP46_010368 [Phenoliferia psychrophenolica]